MKIKTWLQVIESIGDETAIIGDSHYQNGTIYFYLTLAKDDGDDEMRDATPVEGN